MKVICSIMRQVTLKMFSLLSSLFSVGGLSLACLTNEETFIIFKRSRSSRIMSLGPSKCTQSTWPPSLLSPIVVISLSLPPFSQFLSAPLFLVFVQWPAPGGFSHTCSYPCLSLEAQRMSGPSFYELVAAHLGISQTHFLVLLCLSYLLWICSFICKMGAIDTNFQRCYNDQVRSNREPMSMLNFTV